MKLAVPGKELLSLLTRVQKVIERRHSMSILQNLLLEADNADNSLTITAFDTTVEAVALVGCKVEVPGSSAVLAQELCDWVVKLDGGEINLALEDGLLALRCGRSRAKLPVRDPQEYPRFELDDDEASIQLPAVRIGAMLEQVGFAASNDEIRHYLNGVFFHVKPEEDGLKACVVATDGHRLACAKRPTPDMAAPVKDSPVRYGIIIPRKTVGILRSFLREQSAETLARLTIARNGVRVKSGPFTLTSKLIIGDFPDYEDVIPKNNSKTLAVGRKSLRQAIERVAILSDLSKKIRLHCSGDKLKVSAMGADGRSASEEVDCSYSSGELEIAFNYGYLLDILAHTGENVSFELEESHDPVVITSADDNSAVFVQMPLRA